MSQYRRKLVRRRRIAAEKRKAQARLRLLRLAALEDGCSISVGGLMLAEREKRASGISLVAMSVVFFDGGPCAGYRYVPATLLGADYLILPKDSPGFAMDAAEYLEGQAVKLSHLAVYRRKHAGTYSILGALEPSGLRPMSDAEREEQRRSFAAGNVGISNPLVTREMVDREAEKTRRPPTYTDEIE